MVYIYLLGLREFRITQNPIVKVGKCASYHTRFVNYPNLSEIYSIYDIEDIDINVENQIIKIFEMIFIKEEKYGKEYFSGDFKKMALVIEIYLESKNIPFSKVDLFNDFFEYNINKQMIHSSNIWNTNVYNYIIEYMNSKNMDITIVNDPFLYEDFYYHHFCKKQNETKPKKKSIQNKNIQNEIIQNKVIENEVIQNKVIENEVIQNEVIQNEVIQNEVIQNKVIENEVIQNEVIQNKAIQNKVIQNEVIQNEVIQNEVIQNEVIQNEVIQNEVIQNEVKKTINKKKNNTKIIKKNDLTPSYQISDIHKFNKPKLFYICHHCNIYIAHHIKDMINHHNRKIPCKRNILIQNKNISYDECSILSVNKKFYVDFNIRILPKEEIMFIVFNYTNYVNQIYLNYKSEYLIFNNNNTENDEDQDEENEEESKIEEDINDQFDNLYYNKKINKYVCVDCFSKYKSKQNMVKHVHNEKQCKKRKQLYDIINKNK